MIMHLKCTVIPLINASSPCTLHWMFPSVLTEETCRVHVLLWAWSSFMNINEDTRRPTELIKTLDHYYRPTVGILRFHGASSWKPGGSAMLGSHQSSFEINLEIIDPKRRCWILQCDIYQLHGSSPLHTLKHPPPGSADSRSLHCYIDRRWCRDFFSVPSKLIITLLWSRKSSTLSSHYPSDKDSNVLRPSLGWLEPEGLHLRHLGLMVLLTKTPTSHIKDGHLSNEVYAQTHSMNSGPSEVFPPPSQWSYLRCATDEPLKYSGFLHPAGSKWRGWACLSLAAW